MVTQQQDRLDLRGAGELRMGPDQLEEAGHFGIATPLLPNKSKFLFNQYGPLLALIYLYVTQFLLINSYVLLTTRSVISMLQNVCTLLFKFLMNWKANKNATKMYYQL